MGDFFKKNLWEEEPDFARADTDDQGEDGDWQFEENENHYGAQHVIALVDCHPDMFQNGTNVYDDDLDDGDNEQVAPIDLSIKLIQTLLQQTIEQTVIRKTGKRNGVGLLLYNTKSRRNNHNRKGRENSTVNSDDDTVHDDDDDKMDDEDSVDDDDKMDDDEADEDGDSGVDGDTQPQPQSTVHKLLDLEPPGVSHVQTLRKILVDNRQQQRQVGRDLQADFCPSLNDPDPIIAPMQTALEESMRMFLNAKCVRGPTKNTKSKNEYDTKTIWIFTNQAQPYSDEKRQLIQNIAYEAKEQKIRIIVWPLALHRPDNNKENGVINNDFTSPFFESIATEIRFNQRLQSHNQLHDELEEIYRIMNKNRRTYYGPMHILRPGKIGNTRSGKDPAIMIDWYSIVHLQRRPGKVYVDSATKKETVKIRMTLEKDTGKEVAKFWTKPTPEQREYQRVQPGMHRFRQYFNFGNELIPVTPGDLKKINENANGGYAPGLTILGFKPRDSIPFYHSVSKTFVIYPNETEVKGSENAFLHLHAAMFRKNVLAIGEALHRESSQSRLVAIHPFEETDRLPPGMYVTYLPFEDDMRKFLPDGASIGKLQNTNRSDSDREVGIKREESNATNFDDFLVSGNLIGNIASPELVSAAINLMSRQRIKGEIGEDFENAALTDFYSYLKSVAYGTSMEENTYDTRIDEKFIKNRMKKEIDAFNSNLSVYREFPSVVTSRKRTRKIVPDDSGIDWNELYRTDELRTCTVDLLKRYLRSVGLPISGRKDDLLERVTESLDGKYSIRSPGKAKQENESFHERKMILESL